MTQATAQVNGIITLDPTTANLANVAIALEAAEVAMGRRGHLPGMICFTGHSGLGKTIAASYVAQLYRGHYVEIRRIWTRKDLLKMIMFRMGISQSKEMNMADRVSLICEELGKSGRPLILDEFDNVVDRSKDAAHEFVEMVRDLVDGSQGTIIIIGEERLPHKLAKYERFHNRILSWYQAVTSSLKDCEVLARFYYPELDIRQDLLEKVLISCHGINRRICMNLEAISREAAELGIASIGLAEWGKKSFNTGEPPKVRSI